MLDVTYPRGTLAGPGLLCFAAVSSRMIPTQHDALSTVGGRFRKCANVELANKLREFYAGVGQWWQQGKLPVVYHQSYNITFFGLEKLHPFDSAKYGRVLDILAKEGVLQRCETVEPEEATRHMLEDVHTEKYIDALETSPLKCAMVVELPAIAILPNWLV